MKTSEARSNRKRRRRSLGAAGAALAFAAALLIPAPAMAYTTTGCKWNSNSLTINVAGTNGTMRNALNVAINDYHAQTDISLYSTTASGPSFRAQNNLYGATGWEGLATTNCPFGVTGSSLVQLNDYYLQNSTSFAARIRVVWLHEVGHGLGLGHVNNVGRVMHTSASQAFISGGVRTLTQDEKNGINALY